MTALDLARNQLRGGDKMFRTGVKIRIAYLLRERETLDSDSIFIKAVADEYAQRPLP